MPERRHADPHRYEVHEVLDGDPPVDLGLRRETGDLAEAVDFAFEYLERRDPRREGAVSALEIVRVAGAERETVWSYTHARAAGAAATDVARRWGYDVTSQWSAPYRSAPRPQTPIRPHA